MTTHTSQPNPSQTPGDLPADGRPLLALAAAQAVRLIGSTTADDAGRPTPCSEFDVTALVGHLVAVLGRVAYVAGGGHAFDVPSTVDVTPQTWGAAAQEGADKVAAAWADDAVLDRVLHLPFGDVPGRGAVLAYTEELTAHAWDLNRALGRPDADLDQDLATVAEACARRFIPDVNRGQIPFGPVVPVADDAAPYERLVAWLGRDPHWTAPENVR